MRLSETVAERQLRHEVRMFLDDNAPRPGEVPVEFEARTVFLRGWQRQLHEANLVALSWPEEYGGRGLTMAEQIVVDQEMARAAAPELIGAVGLSVIGPTLIAHGTAAQKERHLDRILAGADIWCQGFSEPEAGSDLAALRTRADDHGDHFVLNGHKTWTTLAPAARWCAVLARTNADAPAHRGISYLIVDLHAPGVAVRPLTLSNGERDFGDVFFDDVIVPKDALLGPRDGGWELAMHTLGHERGPYAMARQVVLRIHLDRAIALARSGGEDPLLEQQLVQAHVAVEVLRHQCYRSVGRVINGGEPGFESSIDKLLLARAEQAVAAVGLAALRAHACRADAGGGDGADWHRFYLYGRAASVYGGTAQVQRNIIAERLLGLPRSA